MFNGLVGGVIAVKETNMQFYNDIKPHLSPSALDAWVNSRSAFVRSYFKGEKSPETASMKAGKQIHALIEAGLIDAKCKYKNNEMVITETIITESEVFRVLGIPDSFESEPRYNTTWEGGLVFFVDYKTGKENTWHDVKLAGDLKMKTTAWLVWNATGKPTTVVGAIEYIPTRWNDATREIEPTGEESTIVATMTYPSADLEAFTAYILKVIAEVNEEYPKFLAGSDEFVKEEDVAEYARLNAEVAALEVRMDEIKDRIAGQMDFGGVRTAETPVGTFYFSERKTYDYPPTLKINYLDMGLVLDDAEKIASATKIAKVNFEQDAEPKSVSRSLGFRAKKK